MAIMSSLDINIKESTQVKLDSLIFAPLSASISGRLLQFGAQIITPIELTTDFLTQYQITFDQV